MGGAVEPFDVALFDDVEALARDAGGALDRAAQPSLYDRIDWLRLTARHVLPDATLCAVRARGASGAAWLVLDDSGTTASAFARWYTLAFRPVTSGADGAAALTAIARSLRGRFGRIGLAPMAEADAERTASAFSAAGWRASLQPATGNWVADTEGVDFDSYWRARPARLRNTLARRRAEEPARFRDPRSLRAGSLGCL